MAPVPQQQVLHIVALPTSQAGHFNPLLELCRHLAWFLGEFQVSFILHSELFPKVSQRVANSPYIKLVHFEESINMLYPPPLEKLEALINDLEGPPVSCLLSDAFCGWSQELAKTLGIPRAAIWCTNATAQTMCTFSSLLLSRGFVPVTADLQDTRLIDFLPGLPPLHRTRLPLAYYNENPFVVPLGKAMELLQDAKYVLINTVEELEKPVVDARRKDYASYFTVGPLIPSAFLDNEKSRSELSPSERSCLEWLDGHARSSVLYVAFGSAVTVPYEQIEKIAEGLEKSELPFLWANRRNFAEGAAEGFYETLQQRVLKKGQGLMVEWSPQAFVLSHPSVGGFFTHCGWNSTMEAVCSGVPTLCWPIGAEQNINSFIMVEQLKIGLAVGAEGSKANFKVEDVANMALALIAGEQGKRARDNIQELKEIVRGTLEDGGSSHRNVKAFANALIEALHHDH